jgi:hypothetical protein
LPLRTAPHLKPPGAALHAAVRRLRPPAPPKGLAAAVGAPALELALPHPVYDLRLADILAGRGLEAAEETGARHLVMAGQGVVAAAEVASTPPAGSDPVTVNTGPFAEATAAAVRMLERLDSVQKGSFEVRLLRVTALHLVALWLHADDDAEDMLLALPPAPADVRVDAPYAPAGLLAVLRTRAAGRANFKYHR